MTPRRRPWLVLAGVLVLSVLPAQPAPAAAPKDRPDLRVVALAAPPTALPGARVTVRPKVRNAGRAAAGRTVVRVLLSADRRPSASDAVLASVKVGRLAARTSTRPRLLVVVPPRTKPGGHHLLVCADATRKVRESAEANNCRSRPLRVLAERPTEPPPPGPDVPDFPLAPDPVSASGVVLEEARAVTHTFDPQDATTLAPLTTTAADGTTYTLEVPAEALLAAEQVTLTPLATAEVPILSGGFVAGVQLEPDGLMLQAPARLTVESPDPGPLDRQTAYVFHEDGEDFHAYPMAVPAAGDGSGTVRMELSHFSTAGLAAGTAADRAELAAHPPVRDQAQAASAISDLVRAARQSGADGSAAMAQARTVLRAYYDQVLDGRLAAAESDASLAAGATAEAVSLMRQLALLGEVDGTVRDRIMKRLEAIWANAVQHYWGRCTAQHDLTAIGMLVGIARQMLLLGYETLGDQAWDYALRCSRYEVTYDSVMGYERDHWPAEDFYTQARADLRLGSTTTVPAVGPGVGVLDYTRAELWAKNGDTGGSEPCPCWLEDNLVGTVPGSVTVDVLERANPRDPGPDGPPPAPPVPYVRLLPGVGADGVAHPPQERLERTSHPVFDGPHEVVTTFWHTNMSAFSDLHSPVRFEVDLEQSAGSAVLLDRTWDFTFGAVPAMTGRLTEQRTITVTHTPQS